MTRAIFAVLFLALLGLAAPANVSAAPEDGQANLVYDR